MTHSQLRLDYAPSLSLAAFPVATAPSSCRLCSSASLAFCTVRQTVPARTSLLSDRNMQTVPGFPCLQRGATDDPAFVTGAPRHLHYSSGAAFSLALCVSKAVSPARCLGHHLPNTTHQTSYSLLCSVRILFYRLHPNTLPGKAPRSPMRNGS